MNKWTRICKGLTVLVFPSFEECTVFLLRMIYDCLICHVPCTMCYVLPHSHSAWPLSVVRGRKKERESVTE